MLTTLSSKFVPFKIYLALDSERNLGPQIVISPDPVFWSDVHFSQKFPITLLFLSPADPLCAMSALSLSVWEKHISLCLVEVS